MNRKPFPVRGSTLLLAALLLCLLPAAAEAFRLGGLEVTPSLELSGVYDSNIVLSPGGLEEEDLIGLLRPAVGFAYDYGGTDFSLDYNTSFLYHRDHPERDSAGLNHAVALSGEHAFGERFSFLVQDFLTVGTDVALIAESGLQDVTRTGVLPNDRNYILNSFLLETTYVFTRRIQMVTGGEYRFNRYAATATRPETQDHLGLLRTSLSYGWHPRHSFVASVGLGYNDYDLRGTSVVVTLTVGDAWQVTEGVSLTGSGGIQYLDQETVRLGVTSRSGSLSPFGELEGEVEFHAFRLVGSAQYGLMDSSGIGATSRNLSLRLGLHYDPIRDLTLRAFGLYSRSDSTQDTLLGQSQFDVESYQGGISADYRLVSWFSTRAQYTYIDQQAFGVNSAGRTFKDHRVVIGAVLRLPDSIR